LFQLFVDMRKQVEMQTPDINDETCSSTTS
jgi:hypothetical protein